jgi:hypothetical protein
MTGCHRTFFAVMSFLAAFLVSGCVPVKPARVAAVALTMEDVAKAALKQSDPTLIREGSPAYLMLLDGLLEVYPDDKRLHLAACQAYTSYAATLPEGAESQARAQLLYRKAMDHGFRALSNDDGSQFRNAAAGDVETFRSFLNRFGVGDVPALFWTAAAWGGWIGASTGKPEALADLPALETSIIRALELDEAFHYGGPHLLMAVYLCSKPPVSERQLDQAQAHFQRALQIGGEQFLAGRVMYAEYYARGMKDRLLFESTLQGVIDAPEGQAPELNLSNAMAREKARRLLERTKDFFDGPS